MQPFPGLGGKLTNSGDICGTTIVQFAPTWAFNNSETDLNAQLEVMFYHNNAKKDNPESVFTFLS